MTNNVDSTPVTESVKKRWAKESRQVEDRDVELMRQRIGVLVPMLEPYHRVATADAIVRMAYGIGDDNPLYVDPSYAARTRWGGVIAPPLFVKSMGVSRVRRIPADVKQRGRGALRGVHGFYSSIDATFYLPVQEGDFLWLATYVSKVEDKGSEFARRALHTTRRFVWTNQRGQVVAETAELVISTGREAKSGERTKHAAIEPAMYTPDDIARIDAAYAAERRRGAEPRFWEDVNVGDEIPPVTKGPLTITDVIAYNMGKGAVYIKGANIVAYRQRMEHSGLYITTADGYPDIAESVHWSNSLARRTGNPAAFDYGGQRFDWIAHAVTNWCGDDGYLRRLSVRLSGFNYVGDTSTCQGRVVACRRDGDEHLVDIAMTCTDQRGRETAAGTVVVALPSRVHGPVPLRVRTEAEVLGDEMYERQFLPENQGAERP